jgi:hypothetical protein
MNKPIFYILADPGRDYWNAHVHVLESNVDDLSKELEDRNLIYGKNFGTVNLNYGPSISPGILE